MTNQKKRDTVKSQRELKAKKRLKRGKTRATKSSYVIAFLHLIGWEGGVSFLDNDVAKRNKTNALPD